MDEVRKLLTVIVGVAATISISILVMMHGWGLEPRSWWWIIGGGVVLRFLAEIIVVIGKSE